MCSGSYGNLKQAGGLKFEIKVGPKTFETGERTVENSWLTGKLTGRPTFAIFDELYYLNYVSIFILHVLFSLVTLGCLVCIFKQ